MDKHDQIEPGAIKPLSLGPGTHATIGNLPLDVAKEFDNIDAYIRETEFKDLHSYNNRLAGHIKKEYAVPEHLHSDNLNKFLLWMAACTIQNDNTLRMCFQAGDMELIAAETLEMDHIWINYMKKHEFNPIHNHSGFLSFVIWNKIPFDIEEELKVYPDVTNPMTSMFCFLFGNPNIQYPIKVSKGMQNYICMFPSHLNHCVYPFYTSDDYRVSFAGNIFLRNNKQKC